MYFAPQEFEGVFHNAIQANNPSVINYMPSSCTGSVQDINENIESSSAEVFIKKKLFATNLVFLITYFDRRKKSS